MLSYNGSSEGLFSGDKAGIIIPAIIPAGGILEPKPGRHIPHTIINAVVPPVATVPKSEHSGIAEKK